MEKRHIKIDRDHKHFEMFKKWFIEKSRWPYWWFCDGFFCGTSDVAGSENWYCLSKSSIQLSGELITLDEWYEKVYTRFVRGEVVQVRDSDSREWKDRTYLSTIEGADVPYFCVSVDDEEKFRNWEEFSRVPRKQIRKKIKKKMTKEEIEKELWYEIEIID